MDSKEENSQEKPLKLSDFQQLNDSLELVTQIQHKLLEYANKKKFLNLEDAKFALESSKSFQTFHKYRFTNPVAYAMVLSGMTNQQREILKESLDLIKKGE